MSRSSHGPWADGRRAWERLNQWQRRVSGNRTGSGEESLDALSDVGSIRRLLDQAELVAVRNARRHGKSWSEIAIRLGMTRQSAWEKWRDIDEAIDGATDDTQTDAPAATSAEPEAVGLQAVENAVTEWVEEKARNLRRRSTVTVPRVIGMSVDDAQHELAKKGLAAGSAEPGGHPLAIAGWPNGVVTGQAPEHGARVPRGSVVKLWVERDDGGNAGVREPRRPKPSPRSGREVLPEPADDAVG